MGFGLKRKTGIAPDGSLMRTAEHPGFGSKKAEARGGTRRDVVAEVVTRNPTTKKIIVKNRDNAPQKESRAQRRVRRRAEGK